MEMTKKIKKEIALLKTRGNNKERSSYLGQTDALAKVALECRAKIRSEALKFEPRSGTVEDALSPLSTAFSECSSEHLKAAVLNFESQVKLALAGRNVKKELLSACDWLRADFTDKLKIQVED